MIKVEEPKQTIHRMITAHMINSGLCRCVVTVSVLSSWWMTI